MSTGILVNEYESVLEDWKQEIRGHEGNQGK